MTTPVTTILLVTALVAAVLGWPIPAVVALVLAAANQAAFAWAATVPEDVVE